LSQSRLELWNPELSLDDPEAALFLGSKGNGFQASAEFLGQPRRGSMVSIFGLLGIAFLHVIRFHVGHYHLILASFGGDPLYHSVQIARI